jgi:hypothetical protein
LYNFGFALKVDNLDLSFGTPINFKTPLTLEQKGQPDIKITARYISKPLDDPLYYVIRMGFKIKESDWTLQFIHQKLYLDNPTEEIQNFEISHGYNMLTLNKNYEFKGFIFDVGLGLIVAHAESVIRNQSYSPKDIGLFKTGYSITGPSLIGGIGKKFYISKKFYIPANVQISATYARVPIRSGSATAPNVSMHLFIGMGYQF